MTVTWVKPTEALLTSIAENMRKADIEEVWASGRYPPLDAVIDGWRASDYSTVAVNDYGEPLAVVGLCKRGMLTGLGVVWMLSTESSLQYRREFIRQAGPLLGELLDICPRLCNMVHSKNTSSIRWLRRLGFTIESPEPCGQDGELFHRFHIERV